MFCTKCERRKTQMIEGKCPDCGKPIIQFDLVMNIARQIPSSGLGVLDLLLMNKGAQIKAFSVTLTSDAFDDPIIKNYDEIDQNSKFPIPIGFKLPESNKAFDITIFTTAYNEYDEPVIHRCAFILDITASSKGDRSIVIKAEKIVGASFENLMDDDNENVQELNKSIEINVEKIVGSDFKNIFGEKKISRTEKPKWIILRLQFQQKETKTLLEKIKENRIIECSYCFHIGDRNHNHCPQCGNIYQKFLKYTPISDVDIECLTRFRKGVLILNLDENKKKYMYIFGQDTIPIGRGKENDIYALLFPCPSNSENYEQSRRISKYPGRFHIHNECIVFKKTNPDSIVTVNNTAITDKTTLKDDDKICLGSVLTFGLKEFKEKIHIDCGKKRQTTDHDLNDLLQDNACNTENYVLLSAKLKRIENLGDRLEYYFLKRSIIIGRDSSDPDVHMAIEDNSVLPQHARLFLCRGYLWIHPIGNAKLVVGNTIITKNHSAALLPPCNIRFGDVVTYFERFTQTLPD